MEIALKIINELKSEGLIEKYAIGGAIASIFYIEPITTYDLDIMIVIDVEGNILAPLSPIYEWLMKKGYKTEKEHVIIEGIPVQFLPVYNELVTEAVNNAIEKKYNETVTFVMKPEYLIAIMLDTNRPIDRERIVRFSDKAELDYKLLNSILEKYSLTEKFKIFKS